MFEQGSLRIAHVDEFVDRHPQFEVGATPLHLELAAAHAHHVSRQVGHEKQKEPRLHVYARGAMRSPVRARLSRTKIPRSVAITGTEKNIPMTPAICSPARTPNKTSIGFSLTPRPIR